jgi:hypothetical protein
VTYEEHIEALEGASGVSKETLEAASDALGFVAALHGLFVDHGVLNEDAPIDVAVLENLTDAFHGELAAASLLLSDDMFKGVEQMLRALETTIEKSDTDGEVPTVVRKGFARLASRVAKARELKAQYCTPVADDATA